MSYAFISYYREDKKRVREVLRAFDKLNVSYWIDEERLESGHNWKNQIESRIRSAGAFVLFLSKQHAQKPNSYVKDELEIASAHLSTLAPTMTWFFCVLLDDVPPPSNPIASGRRLSDYQVTNLVRVLTPGATELAGRVKAFLDSPTLNQATLRVRCHGLQHAMTIYVDGRDTGAKVKDRSTSEIKIPAGAHVIKVFGEEQVRSTSLSLGVGVGSYLARYDSNELNLVCTPRTTVHLLLTETPGTGFLWATKKNGHDYTLEVVSAP